MSTPSSAAPRARKRSLLTVVVAGLALLAPMLAIQPALSAPENDARFDLARKATRATLAVQGPRTPGARLTLVAKIRPKTKGRVVVFSRKVGKKWQRLGAARTTKAGIARIRTKALKKKGTHTVRAVVRKTKRHKARAVTTRVTLKPKAANKSNTEGSATSLFAPERVTTNSVFEIVVEVGVKRALKNANVTLTAPKTGRQITPPRDVTIKNRTGRFALGTVAKGQPRTVTLRWKAPAKPGTLDVAAALNADGVTDRLNATIQVVNEPAGSYQIDHDELARFRAVDPLTTDPDKLNAVCFASGKGPIPAFPAAVKAAQAWVRAQQSGGNKDAWKNDAQAKTSTGLLQLFAMAFLEDRPSAMLATALRGHEVAPKDARHLVNAGMAANLVDQHGWAIAFLTQAEGLPIAPAAGMPTEASRLNNLGNAHARMGNAEEAITHLRRALLLDPENPLLERQLATFLACAGRKAEALDHLRSAHREEDTSDELERSDQSWADSNRVLDMSGAVAGNLRLPEIPPTMGHLVGLDGRSGPMKAEDDRISAERMSLAQREMQLAMERNQQMMNQVYEPAQVRRANSLLIRAGGPNSIASPAVQEAYQRVSAAQSALHAFCFDAMPDHPDCNIDTAAQDFTCAGHEQLFQAWRPRAIAYRQAVLDFHAIAWETWTGIQANIHDPIVHELAGVRMRQSMNALAATLVSNLWNKSDAFISYSTSAKNLPRGATCAGPAPLEPEEMEYDHSAEEAELCNDTIRRFSLNMDIKAAKIQVNCESITVGAETAGTPLLTGFAKLQVGPKKSTAMIGSKIGVSGVLGSAAFESALYVEFDAQGSIADIGWEVGPSVDLGSKPLQLKAYEDKVRFTFLNFHEGLML